MNDDKLKQKLKDESYKPSRNEWFTPRLLNKLPARHRSTGWLNIVTCVVASFACLAAWLLLFVHNDFLVITVRDILYIASLTAVTAGTVWNLIRALILADE